MHRSSLLPLMLVAALSLCLASCDDKKQDGSEPGQQTSEKQKPKGHVVSEYKQKRSAGKNLKNIVTVQDAIAYATAEGQSAGAVFFKMTSKKGQDSVIGVKADVGTSAQMHRTEVDDKGVAQMREVSELKLKSGKIFVLAPTGYHIMILGLTKPLVEGETFNITLDFAQAEDVTVPVKIMAAAHKRAGESHEHHMQAPATTAPNVTLAPPTDAPVINEHGSHEQH